ncbi:MAG: sugar kinase [Deltaproteobacteria bacterium]|nr:sugar kinase [Deltaproteobacteria bacterium]
MSASPVLVVGSVAFDTLHLPSGSHPKVLGGSATFASLAASHFAPVRLVGVVGRDWPGRATRMLGDHRVDTSGLEVDACGDTFHWEGKYASDLSSRETLATDLNVFADFSPKIPAAFRRSRWVMLGNIHPALQLEVLGQMEESGLVVADTMNFWIRGELPALKKTLRRVDLLVLNDEEARELSGEHNLVRAARALMRMGPRIVIVKKGEHGALLFEGPNVFSAPAYPTTEVMDPTGAGDTFAGGLIGYIAGRGNSRHETLRSAVIFGSTLASFCVEGVGTSRLQSVTHGQIARRVGRFQKIVRFGPDAKPR